MAAVVHDHVDDLDLPDRRDGKVRTSWALPGSRRLFVTTDRLSAFDRIVAAVPHKGQVLNQLSAWWFDVTGDVVANHLLDVPDPNVTVARAAVPLPVEVVVRGHITGVTSTSLWQQYAAGGRVLYGHRLPDGLTKGAELPRPIVTPTTKAAAGAHDEPLSCADVVERGLVERELWDRVVDVALALFERGRRRAGDAGLLLADTKYELGLACDTGELLLLDEVHTPDSSRFWVAATHEDRLRAGEEPESLDKELVRRALVDLGERDGRPAPVLPPEVVAATSTRYVDLFERLTGQRFVPAAGSLGPRIERVVAELR